MRFFCLTRFGRNGTTTNHTAGGKKKRKTRMTAATNTNQRGELEIIKNIDLLSCSQSMTMTTMYSHGGPISVA